jgi:hypothetical protein
MKKIILIMLTACIIGCNSNYEENNLISNSAALSNFLQNTNSLEDIDNENGIILIQQIAIDEANETINFSKSNIKNMLNEAKNYKYCVIVIEDHTIVKITNFEDCKQSGSWGACMPHVEGYIKKGGYDFQEDYMNNIIGLPDEQKRTAYLFN